MFNNLPAVKASAAQRFKRAAADTSNANMGGLPILKLAQDGKDNAGDWVYGVDNDPLNGRLVAINPMTMRQGWVCWKAAQPVDRAFVPIGDPEPLESELPDHGPYKRVSDGWQHTVGFNCVIAAETSIEMTCEGSAMGWHEAWASLAGMIGNQLEEQPEFCIPLVQFGSSHYWNKTYNKTIYKAELVVVDWADVNGRKLSEVTLLEDDSDVEEDPAGIFA